MTLKTRPRISFGAKDRATMEPIERERIDPRDWPPPKPFDTKVEGVIAHTLIKKLHDSPYYVFTTYLDAFPGQPILELLSYPSYRDIHDAVVRQWQKKPRPSMQSAVHHTPPKIEGDVDL